MGEIAFRVDASIQIGTGHIMRCLTLADGLRGFGLHCTFICRKHPGHLADLIKKHKHELIELEAVNSESESFADTPHSSWLGTDWLTDAEQTSDALTGRIFEWIIVDHYSLDLRWERALFAHCNRMMVIDDLADRPHECDLLLDQNLGRINKDYDGLLTGNVKTLIGPKYALLRQEFSEWRSFSIARRQNPEFKNLLITMGGVDQDNITGKILEILKACNLPNNLHITVILGNHAPWITQVKALALELPWPVKVLVGVTNMAQIMAKSDLAIGASGSTAWERCCLGLPTIQIPLALNQRAINAALAKAGAVVTLEIDCLDSQLAPLLEAKRLVATFNSMSLAAANICDGDGVSRVINLLMKSSYENYITLQ